MQNLKLTTLASLSMASLAILASCQDEDFGYTTQDVRNGLYARNFEKHYGKVAPDQTWDFSSFNLNRLGLEGGPTSSSLTRAATPYTGQVSATAATGIHSSTGDYYTVDPNTISWLNNNLKEGIDNRRLGNPFSLVVSRDENDNKLDFVIIPIYQGQAGMQWDLHLVAEDPNDHQQKDYTVWSKSGDIQYQNNYNNWVEFFYNSDSDDDYDTGNKSSASSTLKLKNAFPNISSVSSGEVKIRFVIPAGKKIEGKFVLNGSQDNLPDVLKPTSNYTWNNEGGNTDMSIEIDLSSLDKSRFADLQFQFWNATQRYESDTWKPNFVNCYEEIRMHVYTYYNYAETGWTTPPTDSFVKGHTINRTTVRSKGIIIDSDKIYDDFFLYLKVTNGQNNYASTGACQRSDEGMMLALTNCTAPTTLVDDIKTLTGRDMADREYFIIGCEDANQDGSDHDINDICFLIAGLPKAPKIKETIKKRYMIEDLGSTFDWDFNDIVVDVTQTRLKSVQGVVDNNQTHTTASLYRLCGTIPFKIQIGNTVLGEEYAGEGTRGVGVFPGNNAGCGEGGSGYTPVSGDIYFQYGLNNVSVDGWSPEDNNITVTTWPNMAGWDPYTNQTNGLQNTPMEDGESFCFPTEGTKYPYIIACDQDIEPQKELINVPVGWFYTKPVIEDNNNTGGNTGGGSSNNDDHTITWNNNYSYALNSWSNKVELPASEFQNIAVGDNIVAYFTNNGGANAAMKPINSDNEYSDMSKDWNNNNTITLSVTDSNIGTLKSNGMKIIGENVAFNRIVLSKPISVTAATKIQGTDNTVPGDNNITKSNNSSSVTLEAKADVYADTYFYKFVEWQDASGNQVSTNRSFSVSEEGTYTAIYKIYSNVFSLSGNQFADNATSFRLADGTYSVRIKKDDSGVAGLKTGDKIIINISDVSSGAKYVVKRATGSWDTMIVNATDISQDATSFSFEVTSSNIDNIKAGFAIQCQNAAFTVNSVEVVAGVQKPTSGTYTFGAADMNFDLDQWSYHVDINKEQFSNIKNGDVIKVTFAKNGGNATLKDLNAWSELDGLQKDFNSNPATITLTVNDNNRQKLINYGMAVQGEGVTFVKAELIPSADPDTPSTPEITTAKLFGGEVSANWQWVSISLNSIDWTGKTKLVIEGSINDQYIRLSTSQSDEGTLLNVVTLDITWSNNHFENGVFETDLTNELINGLKNSTIYLAGSGKITSIEVK